MKKAIAITACILLFATGASARSLKFSDQEKAANGGVACDAEMARAAQSAKEGKFKPADMGQCEQWSDYVQKNYNSKPGN